MSICIFGISVNLVSIAIGVILYLGVGMVLGSIYLAYMILYLDYRQRPEQYNSDFNTIMWLWPVIVVYTVVRSVSKNLSKFPLYIIYKFKNRD